MQLLEFLLHLDTHLANLITLFGPFIYVILFGIVFAETGLVIFPILPGDSLLFVAGTLAGGGFLNIWIIYFSLLIAAILGDSVNYWIGHHFGAKVFTKTNSRLFNKTYLEKTNAFYAKHGGKTIILARFLPIMRTFAPFVAGIGKMHYRTFFFYNVVGGFIWVTLFTLAGYFFGGLAIIKNNFEYAVVLIVIISVAPVVVEVIKHKMESAGAPSASLRAGKAMADKGGKKPSYQEIQKTFKKEHLND